MTIMITIIIIIINSTTTTTAINAVMTIAITTNTTDKLTRK